MKLAGACHIGEWRVSSRCSELRH